MKKILLVNLLLFLALLSFSQESSLLQFLKSQPVIQQIEKIDGNRQFTESYKIMVKQPLDHNDTTVGFFYQRVFVSDVSKDAPVVLVTEGYVAPQARRLTYLSEPARILHANQIEVEHRYFGESWPKNIDWKYLTVKNAAGDHHLITELFKKYYTGKWVNTGVSKGGQTATYHRTFYPDDVDVTIAYVAPLNFSVEDERLAKFIAEKTGTPELRKHVQQIQLEVLKRRKQIYPMFHDLVKEKKYTFRIPEQEVYDYCVLEYPFAFWQYGINPDALPDVQASDSTLFNHLFRISSPSYFSIEGMEDIKSFFVQAQHELGYYGYNIKPLKKYLKIKSSKGYLTKIFLTKEMTFPYNPQTMLNVQKFLDTTNKDMIFIYGAYDPWGATAVNIPNKPNLLKVVRPEGAHNSRIGNMPDDLKNKIISKLEDWLVVPIDVE